MRMDCVVRAYCDHPRDRNMEPELSFDAEEAHVGFELTAMVLEIHLSSSLFHLQAGLGWVGWGLLKGRQAGQESEENWMAFDCPIISFFFPLSGPTHTPVAPFAGLHAMASGLMRLQLQQYRGRHHFGATCIWWKDAPFSRTTTTELGTGCNRFNLHLSNRATKRNGNCFPPRARHMGSLHSDSQSRALHRITSSNHQPPTVQEPTTTSRSQLGGVPKLRAFWKPVDREVLTSSDLLCQVS